MANRDSSRTVEIVFTTIGFFTEMPILAFSSLLRENKKIPVIKCYPQWE